MLTIVVTLLEHNEKKWTLSDHERENFFNPFPYFSSMKAQTQWEYKVVSIRKYITERKVESIMNDLGEQGWEMVSIFVRSGFMVDTYYFKRPKL
jgi:hypothetical protein